MSSRLKKKNAHTVQDSSQWARKFTQLILFLSPEQNFFKDPWNTFDFITVIGSIVDALVVEFGVRQVYPRYYFSYISIINLMYNINA